jgi:hypothetical protein
LSLRAYTVTGLKDYEEARALARTLIHEYGLHEDAVWLQSPDNGSPFCLQVSAERVTLEKIKLFSAGWSANSRRHFQGKERDRET